MAYRNILLPTDFSRCAEQAFDWAARIARDQGADLHVLHASVPYGFPERDADEWVERIEDIQRESESLDRERLERFVARARGEGATIRVASRRSASVGPAILDYIDEQRIDLAILGTHGYRGLAHLALGSVAEEVVRRAGCPVLTVRELETPNPIDRVERILVPLDLSDRSALALSHAKELAACYDAKLLLLHVVETPVYPSFYALSPSTFGAVLENVEEDAHRELETRLEKSPGPQVAYETYVRDGLPARDILEFSEEQDADLIVLTTHGLSGLKRFFLGGVAEKVSRRAQVPVLTVRSRRTS